MSTFLAVVGSLAILLGFITAVLSLANQRKIKTTAGAVQEVHVLVNQQLSDVLARVAQLTEIMHAGGLDIPPAPGGGNTSPPASPPPGPA
jgi:hypothetical protein